MKFTKYVVLVAVFLTLMIPTVYAADAMSFAYVDVAKIFDEYKKTQAFDSVLEAEHATFQNERNQKIEKIRELQGKLALLKDDEKAKIEEEMETLKNEILEFDREKRTDLTKNRDEKVREILLEIEKTVSDYAKDKGITFVFNDRVLIYGTDTLDITATILEELNASYKK